METIETYGGKKPSINIEALTVVAEKHAAISALIQSGSPIDPQLSKNFVSFPLSDNPYQG